MRAALLALALLAGPAGAETDPSHIAQRAMGQLEAAAQALAAAEGARDRVAALTRTVQAYEEGLSALRAGLRAASQRERALALAFEAKREEVQRLLGVLTAIGGAPGPLQLLHPSGPLGTVRSGMILSDVTPGLQREANTLRAQLEELALLRSLQEGAAETLARGLRGAQEARTALSQAVADRTDLPARFATDPAAMSDLLQSSDTLAAFAAGLGSLRQPDAAPVRQLELLRGELALPVDGLVLRRFGEADATGVSRPGLVIAARPAALVTAPVPGTIRYVGPLLDYGNVMILEPSDEILMVFAGLGDVYGAQGQVVPAGHPMGLMGGAAPDAGEFLATPQEGAGAARSETLYIEVRRGETPEDPATWFAVAQDR